MPQIIKIIIMNLQQQLELSNMKLEAFLNYNRVCDYMREPPCEEVYITIKASKDLEVITMLANQWRDKANDIAQAINNALKNQNLN